jgi:hypothetical protein
MVSMLKTTTNLIACALLPAIAACESGQTCTVSSADALQLVSPESCPTIIISHSELVSLEGLDLSEHGTHVQAFDNPLLTDVTAAQGAIDLLIFNNPALRVIDLDLRNGMLSRENAYESVTLVLDPVNPLPGDPFRPVVEITPSPVVLNLSCRVTCELNLALADVDGMTIVIDENVTVSLFVSEPVEDWTVLQGAGVPSAVRFSGTQDGAILQEYRNWLESEGFAGSFVLCNANDDCEEIAPS